MKNIYKYMLVLLIPILVGSCNFKDTNIDPTSVTEDQVTLDLMLPKVEVQAAYNLAATSGRMAGIFMQYFRGVEAQQAAITNYVVNESDVNNTWEFQLYTGSLGDSRLMLNKAEVKGAPYYAGIAKVIMAQSLGFATQLWGDIPYTEAFQGNDNLFPVFDTQELVFSEIQLLLDGAIADFAKPAEGRLPGSDDLIYGGDVTKWANAARALKARYHLMLSGKNGASAYTNALADINAGVMTTVEDQPDFFFGTAANDASPMALIEADRGSTLQVDPDFANTVLAGDPRAGVYFLDDGNLLRFADDALFWGRNESPLPLISYTEVKFIESEALLMTGNVTGAEEALAEAILSNMHQVGLDSASASVTGYVGLNAVLSSIAGTQNQLDKLIEEKYKALFVQGMVESWSDYRRTGFPSFIVAEPGANLTIVPRRLPYPQSERLTNEANVSAASDSQGGSTLEDNLWAFN